MELSTYELNMLMVALNDHESILCTDLEAENKVRPFSSKAESLRQEMRLVRELSYKIGSQFNKTA